MSFVKVIVNTTRDSFTNPFNYGKQVDDSLLGRLTNKSAQSAILTQEQQDAAAAAKAQTDAAVEANNLRVATKRAYQANALALGGNDDDSLGAPGMPASVLASGASPAQRAAAATTAGATPLGSAVLGASSGRYSYGGYGGGNGSSRLTSRTLPR